MKISQHNEESGIQNSGLFDERSRANLRRLSAFLGTVLATLYCLYKLFHYLLRNVAYEGTGYYT